MQCGLCSPYAWCIIYILQLNQHIMKMFVHLSCCHLLSKWTYSIYVYLWVLIYIHECEMNSTDDVYWSIEIWTNMFVWKATWWFTCIVELGIVAGNIWRIDKMHTPSTMCCSQNLLTLFKFLANCCLALFHGNHIWIFMTGDLISLYPYMFIIGTT